MEPDAIRDSNPPAPKWSSPTASVFAWAQQNLVAAEAVQPPSAEALALQQQLEQELAAARDELAAMHQLLEEIPQIFERKFQQRIQPILEDNANLRSQLQQLQGAPAPLRQLQLPPARRSPRIRKALRHAFGLPASRPQPGERDNQSRAA